MLYINPKIDTIRQKCSVLSFLNLGEIIYYYYNDALHDGIIPPYKLIRMEVYLTEQEYCKYEEYTDQIRKVNRTLFTKYPELEALKPSEFFKKLGSLYEKPRIIQS